MPGNRPTKMPRTDRSTSKLRNQARDSPLHSDSTPQPMLPRSQAPSPDLSDGEEDEDLEFLHHFDSLKPNYQAFEDHLDEEEFGDMDELFELSMKDLTDSMVEFMVEDDEGNLDWIPERLRKKAEKARKCELSSLLTDLQ